MTRYVMSVIIAALIVLTDVCSQAAVGADLIRKWVPFTEDIIKFGKKAPKATKNQVNDILRRFPKLEGRSPDLINGVIAIEKVAQKSPAAGKMIEAGINPVEIAKTAERHPAQLKLGNEIGEMFAKMDTRKIPASLPPPASAAMRRIDGNYSKAGESFLEMASRGGKGAVEVAERLYNIATSPGVYALAAAGYLAWHMTDPEGAEESVREFFRDQVTPAVNAVTQSFVESGGDVADKTLQSVVEQGARIWENHWKLVSAALIICIFIFIPNLRRLVFAIPDAFFGKLLPRVRNQAKSAENISANDTEESNPINVYRRRK